MNYNDILLYVKEKHKGQKRKQGTEYYTHPVAVANLLKNKGFDIEYQAAGLCHDLLEDTDATYEEIVKITNKKVADVVKILTKEKTNFDMESYISKIKECSMAKIVKLADRIHNLSEASLASLSFQKKYILETEEYYIPLSKCTIFEDDLKRKLDQLKENYCNNSKIII